MLLSVRLSYNCSAWMDLNIILEPGDWDIFMRELQLEASRFAFLYSLVLEW